MSKQLEIGDNLGCTIFAAVALLVMFGTKGCLQMPDSASNRQATALERIATALEQPAPVEKE